MKKHLLNIGDFIKNTRFVIGIIYNVSRWRTVFTFIIQLMIIPVSIISAFLMREIFDMLVEIITAGTTDNIRYGVIILLISLALELSVELIRSVSRTQLSILGQGAQRYVNKRIMVKTSSLSLEQLDDKSVIEKLDRARNAANFQWVNLLQQISDIISSLIEIISWSIVLSAFRFWIGPVIILGALPGVIFERKLRRKAAELRRESTPEIRKINYIENIMTQKNSLQEIILAHLPDRLLSEYNDLEKSYNERSISLLVRNQRNGIITTVLSELIKIASTVYFLVSAILHVITLGDFSLYRTAVSNISMNVSRLITIYGFAKDRNDIITAYNEFISIETLRPSGTLDVGNINTIELDNVSFRYPSASGDSLKGVSLKINKGERIAIVGRNGAGKTTLAKIISGIYQPNAGKVIYNGVGSNDIDIGSVYSDTAFVFQNYTLFGFSLAKNVSLSDDTDRIKLGNVLSELGFDSDKLPAGEDTFLTTQYDPSGVDVSGGEAQKIAIARALYKQADIYVFDEPTASLDPLAEAEIYRKYFSVSGGKTMILISHRLSSVVMCDRILVVDNGEIVESGTHDELMNKEGIYKEMFNAQANNYIKSNNNTDKNTRHIDLERV